MGNLIARRKKTSFVPAASARTHCAIGAERLMRASLNSQQLSVLRLLRYTDTQILTAIKKARKLPLTKQIDVAVLGTDIVVVPATLPGLAFRQKKANTMLAKKLKA